MIWGRGQGPLYTTHLDTIPMTTKSFPPADDALTALAEVVHTCALIIDNTDWAPIRANAVHNLRRTRTFILMACALAYTLGALLCDWWVERGRSQTMHIYAQAQEVYKVCVHEAQALYADIRTLLIHFDVIIDTPIALNLQVWKLADLKVYANHTGRTRKSDLLKMIG